MVRTEVIEWLKSIKEKYIHGGDDFYDHQRRTAIDYAVCFLEGKKPMTNADRIRAMSDEELAKCIFDIGFDCHLCSEHERLSDNPLLRHEKCDEKCTEHCLKWLQQSAKDV